MIINMLSRRNFLRSSLAAPAIIAIDRLMPVRAAKLWMPGDGDYGDITVSDTETRLLEVIFNNASWSTYKYDDTGFMVEIHNNDPRSPLAVDVTEISPRWP
jgi:YD repeat-containing protein